VRVHECERRYAKFVENIIKIGGMLIISQAVVIKNNKILMVKQYVQRGDIVWNFPGGGIEEDETPEFACVREVKEETGFEVVVGRLLHKKDHKYTYLTEIIGGSLQLDKSIRDNDDIIDLAWIELNDEEKFDDYTRPIIELVKADKGQV
jgi:8-oxo-dGTP diphosphatase